jgi:preprotein translocase subunit SecA
MQNPLARIFDQNRRELGRLNPVVEKINSFEPEIKKLSDKKLAGRTKGFRDRLEKGETLDDILPGAFAVARETARRAAGMRPYDVQLMAGIVLHQGKVAEQKTGEGKTLSAVMPLYLNALTGRGAHLITVNDYLARRDCEWMGPIYHFLGLSVGCLNHEKAYLYDPEGGGARVAGSSGEEAETPEEMELGQGRFLREVPRHEAYRADITYGTNNEFGFDYLRDNMVYDLSRIAQANPRGEEGTHHYAIIDEVDFILIDEARTPLIISAPEEEATQRYYHFANLVKKLTPDIDFKLDEKARAAYLTDIGIRKLEKLLGVENLYERDFETIRMATQAVQAAYAYKRDKDYIVKDDQVVIVDEFTGRLMFGRRYSEGLHQAIEAKEGVPIKRESRTLATISLQNYFRMYEKLAGMTGTAATEAEEFDKVYDLDVVAIPANKPVIRDDRPDIVYKTEAAKFKAAVDEISRCYEKGQPVLVGTTSIEKNELLSKLLKRRRIRHEVLNAKHHEKEAYILAKAGEKGAVTVATNMAGRGVDIVLGEGVIELGGLYVIGTERHEARRIDNQLRGRAGRQGDPGSSRFFVSLQDDLMRIFGGQIVESLMNRFGLEDDVPLESGLTSRAIETAQKRVEGHNFDIRKRLVEYDDVMNKHREIGYTIRRKILEGGEETEEWLLNKLRPFSNEIRKLWVKREEELGEVWPKVARQLTLQTFDLLWLEHIDTMDHLRKGIGFQGYGGRDPLVEYKKEARPLFEKLINTIWGTVAERLEKVEIKEKQPVPVAQSKRRLIAKHPSASSGQVPSASPGQAPAVSTGASAASVTTAGQGTASPAGGGTVKRSGKKVGRNDPCPCGSGKKYKKCCYPKFG